MDSSGTDASSDSNTDGNSDSSSDLNLPPVVTRLSNNGVRFNLVVDYWCCIHLKKP